MESENGSPPITPSKEEAVADESEVESEGEDPPEPTKEAEPFVFFHTADGKPIHEADLIAMLEERGMNVVRAGGAAASSSGPREYKYCIIADSGFGCVPLVVAGAKVGLCFICSVKTAHSRFPKQHLYDLLKDAPSGKWVLMETTIDGVEVVCAGYKYNSKRVLFFTWPKGAANCVPGEPYIATYLDENGHRVERPILRLAVLSRYFSYANVVDVHDQMRQGILDLEYTWVTQNCWFRIATTFLGMTVTDAYIAFKRALPANDPDKEMCLMRFADELAMELISNKDDEVAAQAAARPVRAAARRLDVPADDAPEDIFEASLAPPNIHRLESYGVVESASGKRYNKQKACKVCGKETSSYCAAVQCGEKVAICREGTSYHSRNCFIEHKKACFDAACPEMGGAFSAVLTSVKKGKQKKAAQAQAPWGVEI
jgi:hypothetical protein